MHRASVSSHATRASALVGVVFATVLATAVVAGCAVQAGDTSSEGSAALAGNGPDAARKKPFANGEGSAAIALALSGGTFAGDPNAGDGDGTIFGSVVLNANGTFTATAGRPSEFVPNERNAERGRWGINAFSVPVANGTVVRHSLVLNTATDGVLTYDFNADPEADGSGFVLNDQPVQQRFDRVFVF